MTEYNYFCWSTEYDSDTSFQQPRYRIFNVQVTKEEYEKVVKLSDELKFDANEHDKTRFSTAFKKMWTTLSEKRKQEYYNIPHFDPVGFEYITGVKVEKKLEGTTIVQDIAEDNTIIVLGKKYKLVEV